MTTVNGLDVFHGDGPVDWTSVAAAGIEFAHVKASEGVAMTDSRFAQNWKAMKEAGVMRGAYHFFHPASSPEDQAGHFLAVMSDFSEGDLPPALDLEETSQALWAGIHGLTALLITHPGFPFVERERLIRRTLEVLVRGVSVDCV